MYIDPGAGSLILQVLAAGVLSAGVAFRRSRVALIHALRSLFSRERHK